MTDKPRPLRWLAANLEELACVLLMGFMALLGFINVVARYLGYSLAYTEELLVAMMVWITLLGAAVGFKRGAHLGLNFIRERMPLPMQKALEIMSLLLVVGTVGTVAWLCALYQIPDEIALDTRTQALDIPTFYYTLAIPLGAISIIIRAFQAYLGKLRVLSAKGGR